jgi:hypothetical protein
MPHSITNRSDEDKSTNRMLDRQSGIRRSVEAAPMCCRVDVTDLGDNAPWIES